MRIIAGRWKGMCICAPEGLSTRPTIDRIRESLVSSLYSALNTFNDVVVLDAFAGSGALGLEALSRGAKQAWFYEQNSASVKTLTENIEKLPACAPATVVRHANVLENPPLNAPEPFGLVFLDPPYHTNPQLVFLLLESLERAQCLTPWVTISYEHSRDTLLDSYFGQSSVKWDSMQTKTYGGIAIDIFGKANS